MVIKLERLKFRQHDGRNDPVESGFVRVLMSRPFRLPPQKWIDLEPRLAGMEDNAVYFLLTHKERQKRLARQRFWANLYPGLNYLSKITFCPLVDAQVAL